MKAPIRSVRRHARPRASRSRTAAWALLTVLTSCSPDAPTSQKLQAQARPYLEAGDLDAARPLLERAFVFSEDRLAEVHRTTEALSLTQVGTRLAARGEPELARPLLQRATGLWELTLGPESAMTARTRAELARVLAARGEARAARELLERALDTLESALGPEHPESRACRATLESLPATGDSSERTPAPDDPPE